MSRRASFCEQVLVSNRALQDRGVSLEEEQQQLAAEISAVADGVTAPFQSKFLPSDMRQLALVAHNHMKPAMKEFIQMYSQVLMKFRITGTQTTIRMCKTLWGEEKNEIKYGLTCTSGPLGGDAQIASLMCMEDLGALIFFVDPLSAHPHQADIDSLIRLSNCGNVIVCPNPTSAMSMMHTLKLALTNGNRGMIPSFFQTLESPAVAEYKHQQELALMAAVTSKFPKIERKLNADPSMYFHSTRLDSTMAEEENDSDDEDYLEFLGTLDTVEDQLDAAQDRRSSISCRNGIGTTRNTEWNRGDSFSRLHGMPQQQKKKKIWKLKSSLVSSISKRF